MNVKNLHWTSGTRSFYGKIIYPVFPHNTAVPGVLLCPNMMGVTASNVAHGKRIAAMGYVVLVADLYGTDVELSSEEAAIYMSEIKDKAEEKTRLRAALDALSNDQRVNSDSLAVVGFCYGGHCALELARIGVDVKASISVHGSLTTHLKCYKDKISANILVLNGAGDPFVPPSHVVNFVREMTDAGANFQLVNYANAFHSFTYPKADVPGKMEYNESICNRAFQQIEIFLSECLT